ncbi:MAG: alpha/beta hydrolase [Steroidobacteraceae bacterium]
MDDSHKLAVIKQMFTQMRTAGTFDLSRDRARYDSAADAFKSYVGSAVADVVLEGVQCEVHTPLELDVSGCIVYFHGGGYVLGSPRSHRHLAAEICRLTRCLVVVPDYSLSPEHPFPAALADGRSVYRAVRERWRDLPVCMAGDSAGGALAVSTAIQVRDNGDDRIRAIACLSPWMDLTCSNARYQDGAAHDQSLDAHRLRTFADKYLGRHSPKDPLASPQYAALGNLPPILVQVGRDEILHEDAVCFTNQVRQACGSVELEVWDQVVHVWHWYWPVLDSARTAIARVSAFLLSHLTTSPRP